MPKKKNAKDKLKNQTMIGMDGKERDLGEYFENTDFETSKDKSEVFVRHDSLMRVSKKVFKGWKNREVKVHQSPDHQNDWCAVVEVVYTLRHPASPGKLIKISSTGDCRAKTANKNFKNYTTALAETRASSRALRYALGIDMVTKEEVTNIDDIVDAQANQPALDRQKAVIDKKILGGAKKGGKGKSLEDVSEFLGKDIFTLDQLTRGEAEDVIEEFMSQ